jgi:ribonuclease J
VSRGFIYRRESGDLMDRAAEKVYQTLVAGNIRKRQTLIERAQDTLSRFFFEETRRKPMVIAIVTQV